jgi:hypothetical protein
LRSIRHRSWQHAVVTRVVMVAGATATRVLAGIVRDLSERLARDE